MRVARQEEKLKVHEIGSTNNVKYNTEYYGREVSGAAYAWCSVFVWWVFKHAGAPDLFAPTSAAPSCGASLKFFENKGQMVTKDFRAGDVIYFGTASGYYSRNPYLQHTGIVESTDENFVYSIEGNTRSGYVKTVPRRRGEIFAAGRPAYDNVSNVPTSNGQGTQITTPSGGTATVYTNQADVYMDEQVVTEIGEKGKVRTVTPLVTPVTGEIILIIQSQGNLIIPVVESSITLTQRRAGAPSELRFSVIKDQVLGQLGGFLEGDPVRLTVKGKDMFYGFIFTKRRSKGPLIEVIAYDQLRYLKNKDTITAKNKTASEIIEMIANDFRLNLGELADTGYKIPVTIEDNQSLFEIIYNALDETLLETGKLYVFYDDFGKLMLRNIEDMRMNMLVDPGMAEYKIDASTAEDYDYTSSINDNVYNRIKLYYNNSKTGIRELFVQNDPSHINDWGILQYLDEIKNPATVEDKLAALLKFYNLKSRKLTVKGAFGDVNVRAGASVPVHLDLGDLTVNNLMVVDRVKHHIKNKVHTMDLDLAGGNFFG